MVCPLFAALPSSQQMNTFAPAPAGHRKVILATNIAETSITIPGVKYVIDTGMVKAKGKFYINFDNYNYWFQSGCGKS